jgi:RNA polymerase sigma-70 factor (ECF subfamily)
MNLIALVKPASYNLPEVDEILARCTAGDLDAFDALIARFQRYVFNIIYQHLGNSDEVDDIAQEVFLRVFKFIGHYHQQASFETWLYKVTLNYIRTHQRRKSLLGRFFMEVPERTDEEGKAFDTVSSLADSTEDPAHSMEHKRVAEEIMDIVYRLPQMYREVLIMRDVSDLSYDEIAGVLGLSPGTVKSRLNRARELVRRKVKL